MDLSQFYDSIGYVFKSNDLAVEALTHPSSSDQRTYERLEFLGDRVLGLVISEWLFKNYEDATEGDIAPKLNELVSKEACADVAATLGLGAHIIMAAGEIEAGGREKKSILGDVIEAIIAALYLDGGFDPASEFIHRQWKEMFDRADDIRVDAKTRLQEWAQAQALPLPEYIVTSREGPDHAPVFTVEVTVEGYPSVEGMGTSKRSAERAAATLMLESNSHANDEAG